MSSIESVAVYLTNMKRDALCYYCMLGRLMAIVIRLLLGRLLGCEIFIVRILTSICGEPTNPSRS